MKNRAFTLVELLVSVGLFSVIMTLSASAYLMVIGLADRAQAVALTADNIAFVLDNMTRSIRTGYNYGCSISGTPTPGNDCSGGTAFTFTDAAGDPITYTFVPPAGSVGGYVQQTYAGTTFRLTDPSINVTSLTFYLSGSGAADYAQPYLRMVITGSAVAGQGNTFSFSVQTSASMRGIDI